MFAGIRLMPGLKFWLLLGILLSMAPASFGIQTDTHGLHAVPAPETVTIDGKLEDWDLSGQVLMSYDVETLKDTYSAQVALMYDRENLYLSFHFKDPIPMGNSHDPRYQADRGWAGDAVQLRFKTDRISHVTAWYYAANREPALQISYGKSLTEPFGGGEKLLLRKEGWKFTEGAEMAFLKDSDGQGYVQEMKLPWELITDKKAYRAGDTFSCGVDMLWGEGDWPVHRYTDNLAEGATSREFFWTAVDAWGPVSLEPKGRLKLPPPSWMKALQPEAMEGPISLPYTLPFDARVTLAIEDTKGRRIRNLLPALPRKKGKNVERWDGLDDDGKPVPPGKYTYKLLYHRGIHTKWAQSFANPGNPSWDTPDGRGAFYADHTPPQAVATAGEFVALACPMGEGGKPLIGCDLNGQRLWGLANRTAFDGGHISLATDGKTLWVGHEGNASTVYRVEMATGRYKPWDRKGKDSEGREFNLLDLSVSELPGVGSESKPGVNLSALALGKRVLAVCLAREDRVKLLDAETGSIQQTFDVKAPQSAVFLPDGDLLVLSQGRLVRLGEKGKPSPFTESVYADGYGLTKDASGRIYLSVRGADQNVKVFSPEGRLLREIGKRGGRPANGPFDDAGMRNPAQIAVDAHGRLWVAEETTNPKRTSVWSGEGSFLKDFAGTNSYAGAGSLNPFDPTMGFADDTVYRLDGRNGTYRPVYSLGKRDDPNDLFPPSVHNLTSRVIQKNGILYVFTTGSARSAGEVHCTLFKYGVWRSAAHMGTVHRKNEGEWAKYLHPFFEGHDGEAFAWADRNGDGLVQSEELAFSKLSIGGKPTTLNSYYWGQLPDTEGTLIYMAAGQQALLKFPITGYTACGAPIYDVSHPKPVTLDRPALGGGNGEGMVMGGSDGRVYLNEDPLVTVDKEGHVLGGYPNKHTSVHGSHTAKAARPGYLIGPSSILGTANYGGEAGEVFYLNGNLGENTLFTSDGLFIQSLFKDVRGGYETPNRAVKGMAFDETTAGGESFGGNFIRAEDGKTYVTLGGTDARVIEVTGLETMRRGSGSFTYTAGEYEEAQRLARRKAVASTSPKNFAVRRTSALVTPDGDLKEWPELSGDSLPTLNIEEDSQHRYGRVQARYDGENLYLAYCVVSPYERMRNAGQEDRLLFKTGDAVDVMLQPQPGRELRLLLTVKEGKPVAVLYEKSVPGTPAKERVPFSSPWRTIDFDRVRVRSEVKVATAPAPGGYAVEAQIPWQALGIKASAGQKLKADVGILFADNGGTATVSRQYWSNKATGLVNDIPGEAELTPDLWGTWTLQ